MILIVGLGNPGKKYLRTRHNIGFRIIDQIAKKHDFPEFKMFKKSLISESVIKDKKIMLAKPQTFMNESGKTVKSLAKNPEKLIVIHDDIDLALGKIRVSQNKGSAGHKGVESIFRELKTKDFSRLRIGIKPEHSVETEKFVLQNFSKKDEEIIKEVIESIDII